MSISAAIGTALGLILVFALFALFCSGIVEAISNLMQMRARYLLTGLRSMLDRPQVDVAAPAAPAGSAPPAGSAGSDAGASPGVVVGSDAPVSLHDKVRDPAVTSAAANRVRRAVGTVPADAAVVGAAVVGATAVGAAPAVQGAVPGAEPPAAEPPAGAPSPDSDDLTMALFHQPLIRSLQTRRTFWLGRDKLARLRNPQYIAPRTFTRALLATLLPDATLPAPGGLSGESSSLLRQLYDAVGRLPEAFPAKASLRALIVQAEGDLRKFEQSLENWYDEQMDRIAGWYKQWSKVMLGLIGFAIAVLGNVDAIQVAHALYVNEPVRQAVVAAAQNGTLCQQDTTADQRASCAGDQLAALKVTGLPIWYSGDCKPWKGHAAACFAWSGSPLHGWDYPVKILGWVLTAFGVSFGAPFWFDALSRLGSLRNTGPKPAET